MANIKTVGVIGAGQMGGGIAHVCALAGYEVLLNDISADRLTAALDLIDHNMSRQVARGIISDDDHLAALKRIRAVLGLDEIGKADLAIEAATENEATKKEIFKALQPHLTAETLLASNTSSISI